MSEIPNTPNDVLLRRFKEHKDYFATGQTKEVDFRLAQLKKLEEAILKYQTQLQDALWKDLRKSPEETYETEISIVLSDLKNHIEHIKEWAKPKQVSTPISMFPSSSEIVYEPLGVSLIVAPFNYPFNLLFSPLIGSISSGCCTVIKPSPKTLETSKVMEDLITEFFDPQYLSVAQGGHEVNETLWALPFDMIFFTGSPAVGKIVMKAAADNLVPLVLELGGKSPCIVDKDADLDTSARRIVWGKYINSGQTCIAPDYLLVQESVKDQLLEKIIFYLKDAYGENPKESRYYCRMIDDRAMSRVTGYLNKGTIYHGGDFDMEDRYIAPTIITDVSANDPVMQDEIFGPIFPVMTFNEIDEAINFVNSRPKPLAFYFFGKNKEAKDVIRRTSSGGACVNDTLMHLINHNLPFGGVGNSGMGKYHGHDSFLAFSNQRGLVTTPTLVDVPLKYAPYRHFGVTKTLLNM